MFPLRKPRSVVALVLAIVGGARAAETIDFNRQILPILSDACFHCHGPDAATREAKLRLDQREGIFRTREGVTVVAPGKPDVSELILRISSQHEDEVMPPRKASRQLKPAEIDLLKRWVAAGAPWGTHWAFTPPQRPAVPAVADPALAGRVRNPVDAFVFARLAREKISPSS
jgi:mono/diheme cytochrome c family protein